MVNLLALALFAQVSYGLTADRSAVYEATVTFEGFIPVFGGQEGKVDVKMGLAVQGLPPESEDTLRATLDLRELKVLFNDATLPLDIATAREYFPKTTVTLTPQGKILKSDAPQISLPVRLPGIDVRRFPDITFIPIEFPAEGIEVGKEWSFKKSFGDSDVTFYVVPTHIDDQSIDMDVKLSQSYLLLENAAAEVVKEERQAVAVVRTELAGKGKAQFDRALGLLAKIELDAVATSVATDLKSSRKTERKLATKSRILLKK